MDRVDGSMEKKGHHWEQAGSKPSFLYDEESMIDYFLKNEKIYQDIFRDEKAVVLLIDQKTCRIIDANYTASEFYGWTLDELKSMDIQEIDVCIMESITGKDELIECNIAGDKNYFFSKHRLADGNIRDVKIYRSAPLAGQEDLHYVVVRDVTEQKKAEKEIILSSFSLQNSGDVVLWTNENGDLLYVNKAACELYDYSREELLDLNVKDIDVTATHDSWDSHWKHLKENRHVTFESLNCSSNGKIFPVEITANYLNYEGKEYNCAFVRNISRRKKTRKGLILSCFSLENFVDAVFWVKDDGQIFYANKAACQLLGYSKKEILAMSAPDVAPYYTKEVWEKKWNEVKINKKNYNEIFFYDKAGNEIPVSISCTYLNFEGKEYVCAVARDITERKKAQKALTDEANWRRTLMSDSRDGIAILNEDGKVLEANTAFAKMLGYSQDEMHTLHVWDWAKDFTKEELLARIRENKCGDGLFETQQYRKDGSVIDVEINSNIIEFSGQILDLCICRDITERKKAEEELKLASFSLDNSSEAVFWMESTGQIFNVNKAACELLGYSEEELLKMSVINVNPVFTQDSWAIHWNKLKKSKTFHIETTFKTKSGKMCPVDVLSGYMNYNGKEYDCAFVRDLTESKKSEKALLESRAQLRTLIDTTPDLVWMKDINGTYLACNAEFEHLYGAKEAEIIGKTDYDFVEKDFADFFTGTDREAIEKGIPIIFEEEVVYAGKNRRVWLETIKSPVHDETGHLIGVLGVGRNIDQRKKSEEDFRKASHSLQNSSDAVAWLEKNGNICFINKYASNMAGYSSEELLSMSIFDVDPGVTQEKWDEHWEKLCNEKTLLNETTIPTKSGKILPVEIISNYMNYEGKEYDCTFIRDLTARKKAEKGLKLACFSLENFSDAVFWTRANGKFFFVNKAACNMLGYPKEELLSMAVPDIDPVFTEDIWKEHWEQVKEKKSFTFNSMHLTKEGILKPVEITVNYMVYGNKEYNCAIIKEISQRLKSENALAEEVHWRRLLMEQSRSGMVILDSDGSVFETNPAFAEMLGYTVEELGQMYVWDWDVNFDREQLINMIKGTDYRGLLFETKQRCKDGTILNVEINTNLMPYSGKKLIFCICRDITEKKKYADELLKAKITAEEACHTKNEFMATMSHELRTPLNSIIGFSEILKDENFGEINEAQAEYIDYISKSGKHLLNVINDILDLSKIEAGRIELNYEQFYLFDSINEVKMSVMPQAMKKEVELEFTCESLPDIIVADRTKFQEIIYNLASNAIKFTPQNGKVTIGASTVDSSICIEIRDTGIGISMADMDKLFQPFRQIKPYLNHELEGTGLGLAIAKKFIEMHGGRISVQSRPGEGSSFTFTVPYEPEFDNLDFNK